MAVTFCSIDNAKLHAGAQVATLTDAQWTVFINQAEAKVAEDIALTGVDLFTEYSSLASPEKLLLEQATGTWAANSAINYDRTGFFTQEAQNALNFNFAIHDECMKVLKDKNKLAHLRSAS